MHVADQAVEQIQQVGLGPMDVLDEDDRRLIGRELLQELGASPLKTIARRERMKAARGLETERQAQNLALAEAATHRLRRIALEEA